MAATARRNSYAASGYGVNMLLLFDVDGTLVDRDSIELIPGRQEYIESLDKGINIALISNQGGPACHDAGWPWSDKYPTLQKAEERMEAIRLLISKVADRPVKMYMSLIFITKQDAVFLPDRIDPSDPRANPWWRKPSPGMLTQAIIDFQVEPANAIMVGDRDEDKQAALRANCSFVWAKNFFRGENE